jgi:hypothetical protein
MTNTIFSLRARIEYIKSEIIRQEYIMEHMEAEVQGLCRELQMAEIDLESLMDEEAGC